MKCGSRFRLAHGVPRILPREEFLAVRGVSLVPERSAGQTLSDGKIRELKSLLRTW